MTGQGGGQGRGGIMAEFEQFLAWRDEQRRAAEGDGVDVPLFEKLADGTERSATLPMAQARRLLTQWGWLADDSEGADDGGTDQDAGTSGGGTARQFFSQITGGGQPASGPRPAGGQRAARKATG